MWLDVEAGHSYELHASADGVLKTTRKVTVTDTGLSELRIVVAGARPLKIFAVDESGAAIANASVFTSDATYEDFPRSATRPKAAWAPPELVRAVGASTPLWLRDDKTDDPSGVFVFWPLAGAPYTVVVLAPDGRIGMRRDLSFDDAPVTVILRAPAPK